MIEIDIMMFKKQGFLNFVAEVIIDNGGEKNAFIARFYLLYYNDFL